MVQGYSLGLIAKKRELVKLIGDGEKLGFKGFVVGGYKKELLGVEKELKEISEERKRFKAVTL